MANEWYLTDVARVMAETDLIYSRIVEKAPEKTKSAVTIQKIIEVRNWEPSLDLYKDRFESTVSQLGCFYIPKLIVPGRPSCSRCGAQTAPTPVRRPSRWRGVPLP